MYNAGNSSKNVTGSSVVDGTLYTVDIADDAVTADKLANSVNTDIATGVSGSATAGDALPKAGGAMTGLITNFASTGIDDNATSTAITITSAENVGTGTASPLVKLTVDGETTNSEYARFSNDNSRALRFSSFNSGGYDNAGHNFNASSSSGTLSFSTGSSERARVTSNGLTFNGDTAAANALDDYEEGTWTAGVAFGGAAVGVAYSSQVGKYTKIGNMVTASCYITLTSKGTSTGTASITGLPFTSSAAANSYTTASLWFSSVSFADYPQAHQIIGNTIIELGEVSNAGVRTSITDANFVNSCGVMINITYRV
jgi:hypothetical protein